MLIESRTLKRERMDPQTNNTIMKIHTNLRNDRDRELDSIISQ
jgi:hypothetical protein